MRVYFVNKEIPDMTCLLLINNIVVVNKVKLLVVIIRDALKWDGQVENMCIKANQKFFMLRILKEAGFSSQELVTIYKGYMRPVLEYAAPLWHPGLTQRQVDQVENIQKRVCRHILGWEYTSYPDSKLRNLSLSHLNMLKTVDCISAGSLPSNVPLLGSFPLSGFHPLSIPFQHDSQRKLEFLMHKPNRFREPIPFMVNLLKGHWTSIASIFLYLIL